MYKVESRGVGKPPAITEEYFTNIHIAKRAVEQYYMHNAATINKKQIMTEGIERRKAALALKNGELIRPDVQS